MNKNHVLFLLSLCLIFVDLLFFTGFYSSDDMSYWASIFSLSSGVLPSPGLVGYRLTTTLPAALIYSLSHSFFLTTASYLLYHLGIAFIAYFLGSLLFSYQLGLLSFFLISFYPGFYIYAGAVLPDLPQAFWLGLSLFFILLYQKKQNILSERSLYFFVFSSGLATGFAYGAKISGIIFVVPLSLSLLCIHYKEYKKLFISGLFLILGVFSYLAFEFVIFYSYHGSLQFQIFSLSTHSDHYLEKMHAQGFYPWERFNYFLYRIKQIKGKNFWLLFLFSSFFTPVFSRKNKEDFLSACILSFSFIFVFIYLTFGSTNFSQYRPPSIQVRYYAPCILPGVLLFSWFFFLLKNSIQLSFPKKRVVKILFFFIFSAVIGYPLKLVLSLSNNRSYTNIYGAHRSQAFLLAIKDIRLGLLSRDPIFLENAYNRVSPIILHNNLDVKLFNKNNLPDRFWLIRLAHPHLTNVLLKSLQKQGYKLRSRKSYHGAGFKFLAVKEALMPWTGEFTEVIEERKREKNNGFSAEAIYLVRN